MMTKTEQLKEKMAETSYRCTWADTDLEHEWDREITDVKKSYYEEADQLLKVCKEANMVFIQYTDFFEPTIEEIDIE